MEDAKIHLNNNESDKVKNIIGDVSTGGTDYINKDVSNWFLNKLGTYEKFIKHNKKCFEK